MPLTGTIPITGGQSIVPSGACFLKSADGNHFVIVGSQGISDPSVKLGCAETEATVWTRNEAEWQADFDAEVGVAGLTASGMAQGPIPVPGTKYFIIPGKGDDTDGYVWSIGVIYSVESAASIVVDSVIAYRYTNNIGALAGGLGTCWCFGAAVVDGELFAVCWLYNGIPLFDSAPDTYLVRLPLNYGSNTVETSTAVWPTRRTRLNTAFGSVTDYFVSGSQEYYNFCTILKSPANATSVMILTYRNEDSLPGGESDLTTAGSEYTIVDYDAQTVGSLTSAQALLGQPWDDVGLGYAGSTTTNNYLNDYSGPTRVGTEVIFARNFVDEPTIKRFRRFTYDESDGSFTARDTQEVTISDGTVDDSAVMVARDGNALLAGSYDVSNWYLGSVASGGRGGHTQIIGA